MPGPGRHFLCQMSDVRLPRWKFCPFRSKIGDDLWCNYQISTSHIKQSYHNRCNVLRYCSNKFPLTLSVRSSRVCLCNAAVHLCLLSFLRFKFRCEMWKVPTPTWRPKCLCLKLFLVDCNYITTLLEALFRPNMRLGHLHTFLHPYKNVELK